MQAWLSSLSNFISNVWEFVSSGIRYFLGLFDSLRQYLSFVMQSIQLLPIMVKVPVTIILTIMVIKFILNLGKN